MQVDQLSNTAVKGLVEPRCRWDYALHADGCVARLFGSSPEDAEEFGAYHCHGEESNHGGRYEDPWLIDRGLMDHYGRSDWTITWDIIGRGRGVDGEKCATPPV